MTTVIGRNTKAVTRALMDAMIPSERGAKKAMPARSTVQARVSAASPTSSRQRAIGATGGGAGDAVEEGAGDQPGHHRHHVDGDPDEGVERPATLLAGDEASPEAGGRPGRAGDGA